MAEEAYYAWSRFRKKVNDYGQVEEFFEPGTELTAEDLGVSEDSWQYYMDTNVVSKDEYPSDIPEGMSPAEYFRRKAAEEPPVDEIGPPEPPIKPKPVPKPVEPPTPVPAPEPEPDQPVATSQKK